MRFPASGINSDHEMCQGVLDMRTKRVLIVGGGSAGWTAAAYLNAALNVGDQKVVEISLVESPDVPRIGVGEATIPNINQTLAVIGLAGR